MPVSTFLDQIARHILRRKKSPLVVPQIKQVILPLACISAVYGWYPKQFGLRFETTLFDANFPL
jgi:hypothetical protein